LWFNMGMQNKSSSSRHLKDHFAIIAEPRTGPAQRHELLDSLMIAVCAMLCGAESFTDMALWGRCQQDWLKTWLSLPNGIPSHDTFNRVFGLIKPAEFAACFQSWTQVLRQAVAGDLIAIDGNSPRSRRSCGGKRCAAAAVRQNTPGDSSRLAPVRPTPPGPRRQ
jgi:hypothetical protein